MNSKIKQSSSVKPAAQRFSLNFNSLSKRNFRGFLIPKKTILSRNGNEAKAKRSSSLTRWTRLSFDAQLTSRLHYATSAALWAANYCPKPFFSFLHGYRNGVL